MAVEMLPACLHPTLENSALSLSLLPTPALVERNSGSQQVTDEEEIESFPPMGDIDVVLCF